LMSLSTPLTALTAASTVASIVGKSARAGGGAEQDAADGDADCGRGGESQLPH
jgi:hypothetical protein